MSAHSEHLLERKIRLNNTLKLIEKKSNLNVFELMARKGTQHNQFRKIQITTPIDLLSYVVQGEASEKHYFLRFYIDKEKADDWNDLDLWEINNQDHGIKITATQKKPDNFSTTPKTSNHNSKIIKETTTPKTSKIYEEKTVSRNSFNSNLQDQIKDLLDKEKTKENQKNTSNSISNTKIIDLQNQIKQNKDFFEEKITELTTLVKQLEKEKTTWETKISLLTHQNTINHTLFLQEIANLKHQIHHSKQQQINDQIVNKPIEKRDWAHRGFVHRHVYCKQQHINLISSNLINGKQVNIYAIKANWKKQAKNILVETQKTFNSPSFQLHFYIKKDLEDFNEWKINDSENNIYIY